MSTTYQKIEKEAKRHNERNDCAVRAVAIVSGMPYSYVHQLFKEYGRRNCGTTQFSTIDRVLNDLQIEYSDYKCVGKTVKKMNLPKGRFMVYTRGHVLAVVNGRVLDWTEGRRHHVRRVVKVTY